jgi:hypothetical protein
MQSRNRYAILTVLLVLALAILACRGGAAAPTEAPATSQRPTQKVEPTEIEAEPTEVPEVEPTDVPTEEPTEEPVEEPTEAANDNSGGDVTGVEVTSLRTYVDSYDYYHVTGMVVNGADEAIAGVELLLELVDENGETLLRDENDDPADNTTFSPLLYTLGPGEGSPFDYYYSTDGADPAGWEATVSVNNFDTAEVNRAAIEVEGTLVFEDEFGTLYVTGNLVNPNDEPVHVWGFSAALVDAEGNVAAADMTFTRSSYLAATGDERGLDSAPFVVTLDGPVPEGSDAEFYADVDFTEAMDVQEALEVEGVNLYIDEYDDVHLVALVTNNGEEVLNVSLLAGIYDTEGTVLDASTAYVPIYVEPGETVPVAFEWWPLLNTSTDLHGDVDSYSVQVDPNWSYSTEVEVVSYDTTDDENEASGSGTVTFSGNLTNPSDQPLAYATVVLGLFDTEDNLVSTRSTTVYPEGDAIAAGETVQYEVTLYLDPNVDTEGFTFFTWVQGPVAE